mmetsp:Transcript_13732/g.23555  ORF Transcript_13732/g.23555 Transcript_13732/m.23555 type:complete len:206 (-) Transcript_13732:3-620(-)
MAIAEVKLQHCFALTQRRLAMETLPRLMLQFVLPVICQEDSLHINARSSVFHDHYPMRPVIFEACFHSRGSPRAQFEGPDPSTPVVRRDCLARALPRRLGNMQDVAEDVASFAPQISGITVTLYTGTAFCHAGGFAWRPRRRGGHVAMSGGQQGAPLPCSRDGPIGCPHTALEAPGDVTGATASCKASQAKESTLQHPGGKRHQG